MRNDIREAQFKFASPPTLTSQHWGVSRADPQRPPSWRLSRGDAAARAAKKVMAMVENCILICGG